MIPFIPPVMTLYHCIRWDHSCGHRVYGFYFYDQNSLSEDIKGFVSWSFSNALALSKSSCLIRQIRFAVAGSVKLCLRVLCATTTLVAVSLKNLTISDLCWELLLNSQLTCSCIVIFYVHGLRCFSVCSHTFDALWLFFRQGIHFGIRKLFR